MGEKLVRLTRKQHELLLKKAKAHDDYLEACRTMAARQATVLRNREADVPLIAPDTTSTPPLTMVPLTLAPATTNSSPPELTIVPLARP